MSEQDSSDNLTGPDVPGMRELNFELLDELLSIVGPSNYYLCLDEHGNSVVMTREQYLERLKRDSDLNEHQQS